MQSKRNTMITIAVAAAVGAVAFAAPTAAKAKFDAKNAHKVDGYHAKQLNRSAYYASDQVFDDFDDCGF
ncbi:MAG: hypothetical protein ACRCYU_07865, partial [Nocardioides sp.]